MIFFLATSDDMQGLSTFFREAWKEAGPDSLGFTCATDETIQEIASETFLGKLLTGAGRWVFIAKDQGNVVGFSSLKSIDHLEQLDSLDPGQTLDLLRASAMIQSSSRSFENS